MSGSLALAKVIEGHPDNIVVIYQEDLNARLRAAHEETESALLGVRWTLGDCIKRLHVGMRPADFTKRVLIPKRKELEDCGALLHWSKGKGDAYRFSALIMAQWMQDNLKQIDAGGWPV